MQKNTKMILTIIVAFVMVVSYIGIKGYLSKINEHKSYIGEYAEYTVTGSGGGSTYSGTMTMEVVDASYSGIKVKYTYSIYRNVTIPFIVQVEYEWVSLKEYEDWGVKGADEIISTKWGNKAVTKYTDTSSGSTIYYFVGVADDIPYRITMTVSSITLTFNLSEYGKR